MQNQTNAETAVRKEEKTRKAKTRGIVKGRDIDYVFIYGTSDQEDPRVRGQVNIWFKDGSMIKANAETVIA